MQFDTNSAHCPNRLLFSSQIKQKVRLTFVSTGVEGSSNHWSTSLCTTHEIMQHHLKYFMSWHDIEAPEYYIRNRLKDRLSVNRHFVFNATNVGNVLDYVQHMTTQKGNSWNLLDDYQYPFDFNVQWAI